MSGNRAALKELSAAARVQGVLLIACLDGELLFAPGLTKARSMLQPRRCGWPALEGEQVWGGKVGELMPPTSSFICPSAGTWLPRRWQAAWAGVTAGSDSRMLQATCRNSPLGSMWSYLFCALACQKKPLGACVSYLNPIKDLFILTLRSVLMRSLFCLRVADSASARICTPASCACRWASWEGTELGGRFQVWEEEGSFVSFRYCLVPWSVPQLLPTSHCFSLCSSWLKSFPEDFSLAWKSFS